MPANGQAKAAEQLNNIFGNGLNQKLKAAQTSTSPSTVTRKTSDNTTTPPSSSQTIIERLNKPNVLSTYRSYTYRFTLACLSRDQVNNPEKYTKDPTGLDLIILRSGGKQVGAMQSRGGASKADIAADNALQNAYEATEEELARSKKKIETLNQNPELVAKFNEYSSGQYDMFIENVQIETIAAFSQVTNTTIPTTMSFDVVEPYSVNGFLETMGTAARVAGWNHYAEAPYVLLIEFIGYPDSSNISNPVVLDDKRYFTIGFNSMDIEITERGTVYKCGAFSWGERGNGIAGKISTTTSAQGNNVGEILSDLMTKFNNQLTKERQSQFKDADISSAAVHDTYEIRFDGVDHSNRTFVPNDASSEIKKSRIYGDNDSKQVALADPQNAPDGVNYPSSLPDKAKGANTYNIVSAGSDKPYTISFKSNTNLRDIIAELVINSEYVRNKLKDLYGNEGKNAAPDGSNGMIDYFTIHVETKEDPVRDELLNKATRKYIFVVSPYQVHRSRFPGFSRLQQNLSDLKKISQRSYNYIYTGKNTEIINFKLQYNYMYYEGLPRGQGINDQATQSKAAAPDGATDPTITGSNVIAAGKTNNKNSNSGANPTAPQKTDPESELDTAQGTSILRSDDPFRALSNNLHKALIDPKASMLLAEMDIMGDPYFLCTGGIGNQLKTSDTTAINDNQVQLLYGDLIIDVEFKNPQDIGKDGFISFNKIQTSPFHGAYRVIKITHQFKEGVFKQHLELNKISGQDPNNTLQFIDRASNTGEKTSNGGSVTADASDKNDRSLKNSPSNNNTKNPPAQPIAVAPTVPVSVDEQQIIDKAGAAALAKAKGVNITELSSDYKSLISKPANTILGRALASIGINIG